ncbi:MAG: hypothetical protein KDI30_06780, partial [Pseudomonadales bacterium]|nr:hypothetical protein [Pseudomonadales bacterium]
ERTEDEDNVVSDEEYQKYMPANLKSGLPLYVNEEISEGDQILANSLVQFIKKKIEEDQQEEIAQMQNKHRLLLSVQKTRFEDDIHKMSKDHASVLRDLQGKLDSLNKALENEKARNSELRVQLEDEMLRVEKAWKIYEARMAESEMEDSEQIDNMRKQFEEETDRRVKHAVDEMKHAMKEKEDKVQESKKVIAGLKEHIKELQNDAAKLISQGGQEFLDRLDQNDVSFVVYHPGAGHINIALKHIGTYLENPLGYAAEHCKVEEDIYREWLVHHEKPVCDAYSDVKKETCGKKLKLVVSPAQFVPGRSNRCPMHWSFGEEGAAKG